MSLSLSLPELSIQLLDENASMTTLRQVQGDKAMVLDFWHTKCVKCPAALDRLNDAAGEDSAGDVLYVACALSQGPGNKDLASDMIAGTWENLTHVFMEPEVKEQAKAVFGFTAVPYVAVVDKNGTILGHGDPKSFDYMALAKSGPKTSLPATSAPVTFSLDEDF